MMSRFSRRSTPNTSASGESLALPEAHQSFGSTPAGPGETQGATSAPWGGWRLASLVANTGLAAGLLGGIACLVDYLRFKPPFNSGVERPIRVQMTDVVLPGPLYRAFKRDPTGPTFQDEKALRDYLEEHGLMKEAYIAFVSTSFSERQRPVTKTWRKKISENLAMVLEVARGLRREDGLPAAKVCNVYSEDEVPDTHTLYERVEARLRTQDDNKSDVRRVGK
jgi:hypothetical protein